MERTRVLLPATSTLGRDNAKHSLQQPLYRLATPNRLLYSDASARSGDLFGGLAVHNTGIAPSFLAKVPNILRSTVSITLTLCRGNFIRCCGRKRTMRRALCGADQFWPRGTISSNLIGIKPGILQRALYRMTRQTPMFDIQSHTMFPDYGTNSHSPFSTFLTTPTLHHTSSTSLNTSFPISRTNSTSYDSRKLERKFRSKYHVSILSPTTPMREVEYLTCGPSMLPYLNSRLPISANLPYLAEGSDTRRGISSSTRFGPYYIGTREARFQRFTWRTSRY